MVRVRPLSRKEKQDGHTAMTIAYEDRGVVTCQNPKVRSGRVERANPTCHA